MSAVAVASPVPARMETALAGPKRSFALGAKLRDAVTKVYRVLAAETDAFDDEDDDLVEVRDINAVGLALELSVVDQRLACTTGDYVFDFGTPSGSPPPMPSDARQLRADQDCEFARALEADQQRDAAAGGGGGVGGQQRESWRRLRRRARKEQLAHLRARAGPEPGAEGEEGGVSSVVLRFADGTRVTRRFARAAPLAVVAAFAEAHTLAAELADEKQRRCHEASLSEGGGGGAEDDVIVEEEECGVFDDNWAVESRCKVATAALPQSPRIELVVSSSPRRRLDDMSLTLLDAGLCPSAVLFVQQIAK